jgi:hypothetical protein
VLAADDSPFPVVFEMDGHTINVPAGGQFRLDVYGPRSSRLTIGHGANGLSVFRDTDLVVEVYDGDGNQIDIPAPF